MRDITQATYDKSSGELAEFFAGFGSRREEVEKAFGYVDTGVTEPKALELGCGDGRDVADILRKTSHYEGSDYSEQLIKLAKARHPDKQDCFSVADMRNVALADSAYDVIFAFAAFLHLSDEELQTMLNKCAESLKPGGVLCMSFKYADTYEKRVQKDKFGERIFYYYHPDEVEKLLPGSLRLIESTLLKVGSTEWFTLYVRKEE